MAQIICENVSLGYDGKAILRNLNFSVNAGDYVCIVGENGSGKSTLMRTLLHLQQPLSGEIAFSEGISTREVGYLPQQTEVQRDFPASVWEIVLSGCQNRCGMHPFYRKQEKKYAKKMMEKMKIAHLANRCFRDLSGGQQQRTLLARALCATEKILILDEPVAGLDPAGTADMYQLIWRLNQEEHITIVMVSHDIAAAVRYGSHILHIGAECFFGTREAYLTSKVGQSYLQMVGGEEH